MFAYSILGLVAVFFVILLINTTIHIRKARKLQKSDLSFCPAQLESYAQGLQKMLRCRTVSQKDSYDDAEFSKLRQTVQELFPLVHEKAERLVFSDDCWVYRLKGTDESRNIMLMSHHDVVDVDGDWKYPGFSGEIAEGKVWGRGAVDTKTPLFAEFAALEELLKEGFAPACNIYIGSSHNEELCGDGIPSALTYFMEQSITFEVILDEGGAVIDPPLAGMKCDKCAMVAVHEKGRFYIDCTATAANSHSSLTAATNATPVERMSDFIHEVRCADPFIRRMNPQVTAMLTHLAPYCSFSMRFLFSNLWLFGGLLKAVMPKINPQAGGMLGTTCTFNQIQGKTADKRCSATAFLRPVDWDDLQIDLRTLQKIADKYGITLEIRKDSEYHAPAHMDQPAFRYTMDCIAKVFPQYPAAPFILPAGSDARTLTDVCPCVLRFAPIRLSAQQLASVHAENENIDIDAIAAAVVFYKTFIQNYR